MPADHRELTSDLAGIVCDYPYVDPEDSLSSLAHDAMEVRERVDTPEGRRPLPVTGATAGQRCWCTPPSGIVDVSHGCQVPSDP